MEIARFLVRADEYIVIESQDECSIENLVLWDCWIKIYFKGKEESIELFYDFPGEGLQVFENTLKKIWSRKVSCDYLKHYDIGLLYSDYCQESPLLIKDEKHKKQFVEEATFQSIGKYRTSTWLYQNEQGEILFEVTPNYPWTFRDPEPDEDFVEYEEWMKNYKPLVKRILSKETVQQWLQQVEELHEKVKANNERLRCKGAGCEECKKEKLAKESELS